MTISHKLDRIEWKFDWKDNSGEKDFRKFKDVFVSNSRGDTFDNCDPLAFFVGSDTDTSVSFSVALYFKENSAEILNKGLFGSLLFEFAYENDNPEHMLVAHANFYTGDIIKHGSKELWSEKDGGKACDDFLFKIDFTKDNYRNQIIGYLNTVLIQENQEFFEHEPELKEQLHRQSELILKASPKMSDFIKTGSNLKTYSR